MSSHKNGCDNSERHFFLYCKSYNETKVKWRNQTGMKLNLGFSCDSWPAVTAVLTVPPNLIKHAHRAVASLFLCIPLFLPFSFFFLQKGAIDIRCKIEAGWGGG